MHLVDFQWSLLTSETTTRAEDDNIVELKTKFIDTFVHYLNERFEVFYLQPLSLRSVFDTRLWSRERSDLVSFGDEEVTKLVEYFTPCFTPKVKDRILFSVESPNMRCLNNLNK